MKKSWLFIAGVLFATCAFAGEALPTEAADWPAKLGMTPKMLFLVLQIGIIIFAAKIGGMLAGAMRLPSVLGELGAGILIGPWALGGIPIPGFDGMFQSGLFYGHALRAQALAGGNPFAATPSPLLVTTSTQPITPSYGTPSIPCMPSSTWAPTNHTARTHASNTPGTTAHTPTMAPTPTSIQTTKDAPAPTLCTSPLPSTTTPHTM